MNKKLILLGLSLFALSGCYKYACPAPEGVSCKPISEVYRQTAGLDEKGTRSFLPNKNKVEKGSKKVSYRQASDGPQAENKSVIEDEIMVQGPIVLPIKIYKYVDIEGDLHRPGYIFIVIQRDNWSGLERFESATVYPKKPVNYSEEEKTVPENSQVSETVPNSMFSENVGKTNTAPPALPTMPAGIPASFQTDNTGRAR